MKYIILVASLLTVAYGLTEEQKEEMKAHIMKMGEQCLSEVSVSEEDIAELMAKKLPTRKEGKCFVFCMHRKIDFQDASGKLNIAGVNTYLDNLKKMDADFGDKMKQVADKCIPTIDDSGDPCETAAATYECYSKVSKEVGAEMV